MVVLEEIKRLIEENEILATEIEHLITRSGILTEEQNVAEDKLDDTLFEIERLKKKSMG